MVSAEDEDSAGRSKDKGLSITGQILIPSVVPGLRSATAHIFLQELKGEDAPAKVIAETTIQNVSHESSGGADTILPFTIQLAPGTPVNTAENDYIVRVWIDSNGDDKIGPDDLYSDERYNVLTGHSEGAVTIKVVRR